MGDLAALVREEVTAWGLDVRQQKASLHSWRCEYPSRDEDPCDCADLFAADVAARLHAAGVRVTGEAGLRAALEAFDALARDYGQQNQTQGDWARARQAIAALATDPEP